MKVSVALATYNGERYLREQLDSIARQTLLPCEIVVGDDGSTDRTLAVLEEFAAVAPFPVRVQQNPARMGHEDNFLSTASRCQGDLIAFCDQDDVWHSQKIQRCASYFQASNVLLVLHSASLVDAALTPLGRMFPEIAHTRIAGPRQVYPWRSAPGFAMLFSSRLIRDFSWHNRPIDIMSSNERPLGHDHWILTMASLLGNVVLLAEDLCLHRRHGNNTTDPIKNGARHVLRETMHTRDAAYLRHSGIAQSFAEYIQRLLLCAKAEDVQALEAGTAYYRDWADKLALRANLHSPECNFGKRVKTLSTLMRLRVYKQERDFGGFGKRALIKDMACMLTRP